MLRDLTIQNYRVFKDFSIDGLARVNLIVGANNVGKTSFLEAVYLLINQHNPGCLRELLRYRSECVQSATSRGPFAFQISDTFHSLPPQSDEQLTPWADINLGSHKDVPLALKVQLLPANRSAFAAFVESRASYLSIGDEPPAYRLVFTYRQEAQLQRFPFVQISLFSRIFFAPGDKMGHTTL